MTGLLRQEHRALAGRVASAHDDHLFVVAELSLHRGRAVVDARPLEALDTWHRKLSILGPGRDDDRAALDPLPVIDVDAVGLALAVEAPCGPRDHQLGAELLGLGV